MRLSAFLLVGAGFVSVAAIIHWLEGNRDAAIWAALYAFYVFIDAMAMRRRT